MHMKVAIWRQEESTTVEIIAVTIQQRQFTISLSLTALFTTAITIIWGTGRPKIARAATLTVYSDKATFLMATSAQTLDPFPDLGAADIVKLSQGNLTFTPTLESSLNFREFTSLLSGVDLAINGVEDLNIDFTHPINSFGFDFVDSSRPFDPRYVNSLFRTSLLRGGLSVGTFNFQRPYDVAAFVGVISDRWFDRVEIREIVGGIDDEYYGHFYTGNSVVGAATPESSYTLGLIVVGFGAISLRRQFVYHCDGGEVM